MEKQPLKDKKQSKQPAKEVKKLPEELRQLVIDTKNYKEKTSSTKILQKLRYQAS